MLYPQSICSTTKEDRFRLEIERSNDMYISFLEDLVCNTWNKLPKYAVEDNTHVDSFFKKSWPTLINK